MTLEAMQRVKEELHVKTVLGVSNVSFGLPQRERLNVAFLSLAIASGLDFAIINPNSEAMMAALASCAVLTGGDAGAARYIAKYADAAAPAAVKTAPRTLRDAVLLGLADEAGALCRAALSDTDAMDIVNQTLIPALDEVGAQMCIRDRFYAFPAGSFPWQTLNFYDSLVRVAVPLFVMLSGSLMLSPARNVSISRLFTKNMPRLLAALLFWGLAYEAYPILKAVFAEGIYDVPGVFSAFRRVLSGDVHFHLYYLFIILGLYLVTPVLRVFTANAGRRMAQYFLVVSFSATAVSFFSELLPDLPVLALPVSYTHLNAVCIGVERLKLSVRQG